MFWKKNEEKIKSELLNRFEFLERSLIDTNNKFNNMSLAVSNTISQMNSVLQNLSTGLKRLEQEKKGDDIQIRQFCAQTAALICHREGGDVVRTANIIHEYVTQNPSQIMPDNIFPITVRKNSV